MLKELYKERIGNDYIAFILKLEKNLDQIKRKSLYKLFDNIINRMDKYTKNYPSIQRYIIKTNGNGENFKKIFDDYIAERTKQRTISDLSLNLLQTGFIGFLSTYGYIKLTSPTIFHAIYNSSIEGSLLVSFISLIFSTLGIEILMDKKHEKRAEKIKHLSKLISIE
jgi:hypothetical protein